MIGFELGVTQLSAVEIDDLDSRAVDIDEVSISLAPLFSHTFTTLMDVRAVEERKKRAKAEREARQSQSQSQTTATPSTSQATKRPPQSPISSQPLKRTRGVDTPAVESYTPTTPDRPTFASNPNLTGGTVESGASLQSKDEENTKSLANTFIRDCMTVLGPAFREIRWQQSGQAVVLAHS